MADTDANETEASSTARIAFDHVRLCESRAHGTPCETCDASVRALPGGKDGFLWRAAVARKGQPVQRLKIRPTFLPFHSVRPIQPGEKVAVVSHPQMPFKGKRLYIPKDCGAFDLLDVKVGSNSQNVAPGAAPAEAFADCAPGQATVESVDVAGGGCCEADGDGSIPADAAPDVAKFGQPCGMDTAHISMRVAIFVRNPGPEALIFRAVIFGDSVDD